MTKVEYLSTLKRMPSKNVTPEPLILSLNLQLDDHEPVEVALAVEEAPLVGSSQIQPFVARYPF